jgi:hypothetical protein
MNLSLKDFFFTNSKMLFLGMYALLQQNEVHYNNGAMYTMNKLVLQMKCDDLSSSKAFK